jgi:hypothetical protein
LSRRPTPATQKKPSPQITQRARAQGATVKSQRGVFNRYLRALQGPQAGRLQDRLLEVERTLSEGTRLKRAPTFEGGVRTGTVERPLPLLPSERAQLLVRRAQLRAALDQVVSPQLRAAFLEILSDYASRNGFTRPILLEVGVPSQDLDEAGILDD